MKLPRRNFLHLAAGAAALPAVSRIARPQSYPSRPITVIVPFPAGGVGTDAVARVLIDGMKTSLGQPIIVENVPGAGGSLGVARAVRAIPDGYTLSIGNWASHVGAGAAYSVQYDVLRDFEPISRLAESPLMIVTRKGFPANDLSELIGWLKANPGKATAGTLGVGSGSHLCGNLFSTHDWHPATVRSLSRWWSGGPGLGRRSDRYDVRSGFECLAAGSQRIN
jgi:tripartite-type tricarboxylate transporter receptor subunit TctC